MQVFLVTLLLFVFDFSGAMQFDREPRGGWIDESEDEMAGGYLDGTELRKLNENISSGGQFIIYCFLLLFEEYYALLFLAAIVSTSVLLS